MNFADKKKAYNQMQDPAHLCCDRELLEKKAPKSPALQTGVTDRTKAQRDILWALLDVATVEEIEAYRKPAPKKSEWLETLVALITSEVPGSIEGLKTADDTVCELLDKIEAEGIELTDDQKNGVSAYKGYLSAAMIELRKKEVEKELIALDLEATAQPKLASIARSLSIEAPDLKKATLIPILDAFRAKLLAASEETGVKTEDVDAAPEDENETGSGAEDTQEQTEEEKKSEATSDQA